MSRRQVAEKRAEIIAEIHRRQARSEFAKFLTYTDSNYRCMWFHKLIADSCQRMLDGEIKNLMIFVPPQHGKLLPSDTPVLTTEGWKKHGDLKRGDYVFGQDGKPKMVLANSGVYDWNVEELKFQGNVSILAAKEHLWKLQVEYDDHKGRRELITETQHIFDKRHRRSPYIDCAPCLEMPKRELPIDPYILGLWLGDGLKGEGSFVSGNEDAEYMCQFGIPTYDKDRNYWRIRIPNLCKQLRLNGILRFKHIPECYLLSSREQREELLCGLMDTDGYVDKRGNCEFTQKKGQLAEDVYILLRSLGYKARKMEYDMTINGRVVGRKVRICFNPDKTDKVFRLPRKAERLRNKTTQDRNDKKKFFLTEIVPHGIVKGNCIQVEGGMYLAGYDLIPTHNSQIISRCFPAWALGKNPDLKIVGCSYSGALANSFSMHTQRMIENASYGELFQETKINGMDGVSSRAYKRNEDYFDVVGHKGFYKAVGVGGSLTGTPVDIAIIDDPVKDALEAYSVTYRQRVWDWYNTVLTTRLHNDSHQLFIMTRWHEDDLAGRILKAEPNEWTVISIPAICEVEDDGELKSGRHIGESLWEEKHSLEKLLKQKNRSPREFSALYQQHPTIEGGNIVKRDWFQKISLADFKALRFREPMHFYLDTAYNKKKEKTDNDPSGILAACRIGQYVYLYNAMQVWKEMPDLLRFLPEYISAHEGNKESVLHIEPKANGISVVQMLRAATTLNVTETPTPTDDKEVRLRVVSPRIECGRVFIVEGSWNEEFLNEVCGFPALPHDEFVDILGYAINDLYEDDDDINYEAINKFNLF